MEEQILLLKWIEEIIAININSNINNSNNHIFSFYTFMNKINNNSVKGKNKFKHKLDIKELINRNNNNKINNFNYTCIKKKKNFIN